MLGFWSPLRQEELKLLPEHLERLQQILGPRFCCFKTGNKSQEPFQAKVSEMMSMSSVWYRRCWYTFSFKAFHLGMFVRKLPQHLKGTGNGNNPGKTNTFKFQSQSSMIRLDPYSVLSVPLFCKGTCNCFQILMFTMFTNSLTKRIFQGHGMWEALGLLCLPRLVPDKVRHLAPWSPRWLEGMGSALAWVVLGMFHSPKNCYFKRYWYCKRSWVGSNKCMT